MTAHPRNRTRIFRHGLLGSFPSLAGFATDLLTQITDSLAVVRLRRANTADLRCGLSDNLAVEPQHLYLTRLQVNFKRDTVRRRHLHRVGIPYKQGQVLALQLGAVTHTLHLENPLKTGTDAVHHVRDHS